MNGYEELRNSAAWIDLSGRGQIRAAGEDRARLLHAMTTNHVQQLTPGSGCYAFFLTAQGRILGDANLFCTDDSLLIDTEPETRAKLHEHLDRFIIADDVTLEDESDRTAAIAVEGPAACDVLTRAGAPAPEGLWSWSWWNDCRVARVSRTGQPGWWIFAPAGNRASVAAALGIPEASPEAVEAVRLENGVPRCGPDFGERTIPHETQLMHALHFNKGCYIGQEIVERVRSRGLVNRLLVRILIDGGSVPPPDTEVSAGDSKIGFVTSAAWSPARGAVVAFAYLRADAVRTKPSFTVAGSAATILATAPAVPSGSTGCP